LIVLRIAKSIEEGWTHDQLVAMTDTWIRQAKIFVSVRTLKYMVRGGRVSPLKGWIARMLNINPIISMDENGKSIIFGKSYSQKSNMEKVVQHISKLVKDRKVWNFVVLHANNHGAAIWYEQKMKDLTGLDAVSVVDISPVVGANAGIGAASVALMFE
jgi:DegV family protein with EDD domain